MTASESLIVELEDAISSGTVERRIETLWRVTDLFIAGADQYSDNQIDLFDDVISRLAARSRSPPAQSWRGGWRRSPMPRSR